jgi:alpha-mannosidase
LGRAWKDVLFNQFHDILAGTSIKAAYEDVRNAYGEAMSIASRVLNQAVQSIAWNIRIQPEAGMTPIVIFNPHPWRSQVCVEFEIDETEDVAILDSEGQQIPTQVIQPWATVGERIRWCFVADLPALGYCVYRIVPSAEGATHASASHLAPLLENDRFRLEFDPQTGVIQSLRHKKKGIEVFAGEAAKPVVIKDTGDTWSHGVSKFDHAIGEFTAKRITRVEQGPVRSTIRVESEYGASRLIQDFVMYHELDQIDVQVTVDWREQFKMLKLRFPVNVNTARATYEIPYGHIERQANGEEEPGQSWIDVSGVSHDTGDSYGLSILNNSKYSFDVDGNDIGLTVLRSPIYAHHLPVVPDPKRHYSFIDQGIQQFAYTLLPHEGGWKDAGTIKRAAELNQRPIVLIETYHEAGTLPQRDSYATVDRDNIIVSVVKQAEDTDDMIMRAYETTRVATHAVIRLPKWNRAIEAEFAPCEIKTWRIPRDETQPVVQTDFLEWETQKC